MSDPERLLDSALPPELASLLRSAEVDTPPEIEDKQRRVMALAATSAPWASAPASTQSSSALRTAGYVALAAVVIVAGSIGIGALSSTTTSRDVSTSSALPANAEPVADSREPAYAKETEETSPLRAPVVVPSLGVHDLPSAAPPVEVRPSHAAAGSRGDTGPSVEDELKTIDAARGALAAQRPAQALAYVQRYRIAFRDPHFVAEADALEVQALVALGRTDEARAKAERFFQTHPGSPYTQRVRSATSSLAATPAE